ncbi:MAG TPA: methyltransferase domain-containing protein [Candidatus Acidoferrales bacterium]|nr:methyltransferase domain-containing protein [Candidatus Acidoferrales bacterium]
MRKKIRRLDAREGYDRWAESYDRTENPLVALDRRHTLKLLGPRPGERVLDAACGTGAHLGSMLRAGCAPVGLDLSRGMLSVTRRKYPTIPLAQADLNGQLPLRGRVFDAALCALVGEHLTDLRVLFRELFASLTRRGRLVFSVFHPELAAAGIEANFEAGGTEYRLGALRHTVADYLDVIDESGFGDINIREFRGDELLVRDIPWASKYLGRPLLLTVEAYKT